MQDWAVCELLASVTICFWVMEEDGSRGSQEREQEPDMTASDRLCRAQRRGEWGTQLGSVTGGDWDGLRSPGVWVYLHTVCVCMRPPRSRPVGLPSASRVTEKGKKADVATRNGAPGALSHLWLIFTSSHLLFYKSLSLLGPIFHRGLV